MNPHYAANVSTLFTERPLLDRFDAAHRAGFEAVECWFPYDIPAGRVRAELEAAGVVMAGINTPPGDTRRGEWGIAALPGREEEFLRSFEGALEYATALGARSLHVLAGVVSEGDRPAASETFRRNLEVAVRRAEGAGVTLLIEPLNARDRPGYLMQTSEQAGLIIDSLGSDQLRMQFDIYHVQIMEGDILTRLRRHLHHVGHVQIAAVPSRAEPDEGELEYAAILTELEQLGWTGLVGCEYVPRGRTEDGLGWIPTLAARAAALARSGASPQQGRPASDQKSGA